MFVPHVLSIQICSDEWKQLDPDMLMLLDSCSANGCDFEELQLEAGPTSSEVEKNFFD